MKQLHIVHILPTLNIGGAERAVVNLIAASDPKRFRYSVIILFNHRPLEKELTARGVTVHLVEKTSLIGWGLRAKLRAKLAELKPDLVHTHLFSPDVWGRLAAHDVGIPVLTTEHNINTADGYIKNTLRQLLRDYSDQYVACSESVKKYVVLTYGITKPLTVIPWGIPLQPFLNIPPVVLKQPLRLMILGRLFPQKGQDIVLEALAQLKNLTWQLELVGDGPRKDDLVRLVETYQLTDRVRFSPATLDVPTAFSRADVVIIPSRWEGLGIVAMEALAAGRIVIASAVGGLREVITHDETGLLVAPRAADVAQVLKQVIEGPATFRHLGEQGRQYAKEHFALETEVSAYESLYQSLCR